MLRTLKIAGLLTLATASLHAQSSARVEERIVHRPLPTSRIDPKEFGIQDDTRTVVSGMDFRGCAYISGSFGRGCGATDVVQEYYANLNLPAGVVIDVIGLNSESDTDATFGVALWQRDLHANMNLLATFSAPAHGWGTDYLSGLAIPVTTHFGNELVLNVEQGVTTYNTQFFAWVEIWWHRTVSPPPAVATFLDVPPTHPFYQFIEAIYAAGITAGCGGGSFCPDQPITRKQEAAFLATALGLHWPN